MIQEQKWHDMTRIIVTDEENHGTVQVEIAKDGFKGTRIEGAADALVYNLWVDKPFRKKGVARRLMEAAENEARKRGCKTMCLEWSDYDSERWVERWYERFGYMEKKFGRHSALMVKEL